MNQDRVSEMLQAIEPPPAPFTLVFSGKTNKKVNGLYKPTKAEIVIHNRNFDSDDQLIYTAIHEYAHHILFTRRGGLPMPSPTPKNSGLSFMSFWRRPKASGFTTMSSTPFLNLSLLRRT